MKTIVLHGDDTIKSYERLKRFIDEAKRRNWEILYDAISETDSLFGQERLTVIRDYKLYTRRPANGTLVIYHEGILPQTFLKSLSKETKIEEYKLPVLIWKFLEGLTPNNYAISLKMFHDIIKAEPVEFIFTLLARQFKNLYCIKLNLQGLPLQAWQVARLKSQAENFSGEQLAKLISMLAQIDIEVKTGKADLVSALDLLIIKKLQ